MSASVFFDDVALDELEDEDESDEPEVLDEELDVDELEELVELESFAVPALLEVFVFPPPAAAPMMVNTTKTIRTINHARL